MDPYFIHLLKSSSILLLFFGCYQLFLKKETFFKSNRWFLMGGLAFSLLGPFISFTKTVPLTLQSTPNILPQAGLNTLIQTKETAQNIDLLSIIPIVYVLGVIFFGARLFLQFLAIKKLLDSGFLYKELPYFHVQTKQSISPFSFFRYIFYHRGAFDQNELKSVIAHEKVHAKEYHSLDILLMELFLVLLWFNPVSWWYRTSLKQNLEFLADSKSCTVGEGKKFYQYLMLKQIVGHHKLTIANPFYSSLIKKRIVMLNQNQSKKTSMSKMLLVLPAVALFLVSFNTKTTYVSDHPIASQKVENSESKAVHLIINKDTSDEELEKMKKDLAQQGIDFSYTVVHNDQKEIINISLELSGQNSDGELFSGNYNSSSEAPIKQITIRYDDEANLVSFGQSDSKTVSVHKTIDHDGGISIHTTEDEHRQIEILNKNGVRTIIIDGKEVSEKEFKKMHPGSSFHMDTDDHVRIHVTSSTDVKSQGKSEHIKVESHKGHSNTGDVMIIRDADEDSDIEVINSKGYLFFNHDGKGTPLFYLDGKKISEKAVKKLKPETIEKIEVSKGEKAIEKYGKKAKNGVVEISLKDKDN